ncbi:uncharacterized protein LOC120771415 [Bactrocera tryoni]|uniref:uncharacterized protein LOC120771415 n=1 Tax=Bactrocera tryoni TaxID=59916 RepID=UPI001A9645A6|nr:uncharacterized protein LOC120771415 [Bactrocera tryoni]
MPFRRCFAHCPHGSAILYPFPPKTDVARRDLWIRQFGKNPDQFKQKHLYACRKHFSSYMTYGRLLRKNGYPDVNLSTYDKDKPYTQRFSYYKPGAKPDPFWHDNLDDVVAMPPLDYGMDLEYVPVECIVPLSNELSHTEDSNSSDDEDIQLKKKSNYVDRKRKCILGCGGKRSLHILPSIHNELERRQKWLYLVGKDPALYTQRHVYVCDLHFDIHMVGKSHLIRGAYPNKNLPPPLIKSIPERLEAETECLQKCSDYKRKFKFPTFDRKRRETWLLKFGRNPAFYTNDIYACDRHFSDEMRVGPYLQSHAVPDQNLALKLLHEDNTGNYVIKTWSLERLQALANATTTSLTVTTTTTTHSTALISPTVTTIATTTTVISPTDTITDSTTAKILPSVTASTTISPTVTTTTTLDSPHKNSPQTPTIDGTAQSKNILDQLKMTVMSTANQTSQTPVEYVKMKTLGVFMQHRDGYVVPLRQILNAVDPLDCRGYLLTEYAKSIEPKLTIKVHPIPKEIYEGISDDDTKMSASPTYKADTVEESDEDAKMLKFTHAYGEQNSTDSWSHEDNNDFSSNLENAQIYNIKRNNYDSGYTTAKKVKFTHTFDNQQNNGDLGGQEDNTDYSNSLENAQIYNIKRNNYNSSYTTAKKVKFTHAFDEQQNYGDLGGQEDNTDYSNSLENAQIYNIKRNNYDSGYTTAKKVKFTHAFDEQQNSGDLGGQEDNTDYSNSLENAQIYNIKRNNYDSGYTTAKKVKFTHAFDEQQNNGDLGGQEDNTDYSNSLENAQIYNIKRNNYDSGYTTAKKVKFTHAFDEQQNNGDLGGQEDNNDYKNSLENAQIYNIKRNNYNSSYITAKKVTFTHTYDEQHNNGDLLRHEDNNDYSNSLENAQIYNIKRNNYDSGYTTAKKVKFTHTYDEQHNNGDLGRHEDNNDYSNSLENVQVYSIKRNNYDSGYTTAKNVKFTHANDEQQNNGELGEQDDYYDYHENNVDMLNFSGNGVHEANTEFAVISDPILDLLAETYPTENFPLLRRQNNTVVKCSTETNSESKTEVVIVSDEPSMAGKLLTEKKTETVNKRVITVQPKQQLHNSKVLTQLKAATVKNGVVKQQPQQQTSLTKAVAFAESWQQVMKTMQKEVAANSTLANMQKQPDAIALAAKKLVEEIKQAGEREKLSIHQKRIAGDLTGTNLNSKQILSTQGASSVATTQVPTKMFNKPDPNAFEITSVEIINSIPPIVAGRNPNLKLIPAIQEDPHQAKITSVEIINSKLPTNVANENTVTFSEKGTPQILQNRKEIMHMMHRPSAAKATIATTTTATNTMPLSITKPPFKTPASAAPVQPKSMDDTIEELLAKAKHILNTKNTAAPANTNNDDDDLLKSAEPEIHFAPISTTQHAEDDGVVPYCVLKCANFRKIYEFPSPEVQTFQRHFWFIQLGLDIATDWRKTLFICDKHFDDTMLLPPDNTLNEYAYPCQSLLRELNKPTATVGTQTCDDAEEYRQKLFDQIAELKQTLCQQKLEVKRVKVLIRLKQEASRLVAEIEEAENAPKLLTIYNKE